MQFKYSICAIKHIYLLKSTPFGWSSWSTEWIQWTKRLKREKIPNNFQNEDKKCDFRTTNDVDEMKRIQFYEHLPNALLRMLSIYIYIGTLANWCAASGWPFFSLAWCCHTHKMPTHSINSQNAEIKWGAVEFNSRMFGRVIESNGAEEWEIETELSSI